MTTIVIPARLKSEEDSERKKNEDIDGLTLIQRVVKQCLKT